MAELPELTATEIAAQVRSGALSADEITSTLLERIHASDEHLNAFNEIFDEHAIAQAKAIDEKMAR
jgi:Asp-tRNA(Asn)/Glu-tRNA(Gln) amidotransferase A subunit family amidase